VNLIHELDPEPPRPTAERPLLLMAISSEKSQSSQWPARTQEGPATVTVHPDSAPGMHEGEVAWLESEFGSLRVRLAFDARQRRDLALMAKGGWHSRGRSANALVPARTTDAGEGAVYYDTPVRLRPA
jgi:anaerobic selenocysteine-containing dehydrogenase